MTCTGLRNIKETEHFQFTDAAEMRDWLNRFKKTDLSTVLINHGERDYVTFHYETEVLSDGSEVHNIRIGV